MKYVPEDTSVTFSEVPNEISLCINISGCPCHCVGCHSSYLAEDIGDELTGDVIDTLIINNPGISCVTFMGGDSNPDIINRFAKDIKEHYPDLKIAWYSGREKLSKSIDIKNFDYIKIGPYIEEHGPLNSPTTNQRMYKINEKHLDSKNGYNVIGYDMEDITYKFNNIAI